MIIEGLVVLNCILKEVERVGGGKYRRMGNDENLAFSF